MINIEELNYLYRYALALCHDETKAYDLVQEGLARYIKSGIEVIPPGPYIKKIIRNYYIDQFRRDKILEVQELDDNVVSLQADIALEIENQNELENILKVCNDDEREILFLWGYDGLTFEEISKELEMPKGTVLSKFHRLKNRIKNLNQEVVNE